MKKYLSVFAAVGLAMLILVVSLFKSAEVKYASALGIKSSLKNRAEGIDIVYELPYPGNVSPNSALWPLKAARDQMKLSFQSEGFSRSHYLLHLANKRLAAASHLWDLGDYDEALPVFSKSQIYLMNAEETLESEENTDEVLLLFRDMNEASLKHRQILEQVLAEASDEVRPRVTEIMNHCKLVYDKSAARLHSAGRVIPENPFEN